MVAYEVKKQRLFAYTRKASQEAYPQGLAYSVHLAYSRDGERYLPLHQNYGILFAEAEISPEDTIVPKCVKNPRILSFPSGDYGILADRVEEDGREEVDARPEAGRYGLLWRTWDFREFQPAQVIEKSGVEWQDLWSFAKDIPQEQHFVEGEMVAGSSIELSHAFCDRIVQSWSQVYNTEIRLPDRIQVSGANEMAAVQAEAVYSDGSTDMKTVLWDTEGVDWGRSGVYSVTGKVHTRKFDFPLLKGRGDPVIFPWEGKWYFLATNDNLNDIGIYVREARSVEELFESETRDVLLLDVDQERDFIQTFWAPEFHVIGGELYILFAVGGKVWGPQCYLMRLKKGGRITEKDSWEEPVRAVRSDGSPLTMDGITLDMTYLSAGGNSYMVWSYRKGIGTPMDTGSMLYIARIKENEPWKLAGEPVLLSRPLFGWENVNGTINNEGPHGFVKSGKVYLTYSGGAANGYTYALGLLTADANADLTAVESWKKSGVPVLSFYSVKGEYGPGHNSFFTDEEGNLMIAYHGETEISSNLRCDDIRRVHFDINGEPIFDLWAERDLNPALRQVSMEIEVI